jgi:D-tyrosyl-tRNA(Tyr) deacylase
VIVEGEIIGSIRKGLLVYLGVGQTDTEDESARMAGKVGNIRIFEDRDGKINLSLADVKGEVLIVSQFTLYANCKKGNRPSFIEAAPPELALKLYERFIEEMRSRARRVSTGQFGASMQVISENSGPFTIMLDSDKSGS